MTNDEKWIELQQAEDMAYFKADLCCYSPESYTLEEKREQEKQERFEQRQEKRKRKHRGH